MGKLGARLIKYRCNTVWDQIGRFKVDFVDLLIRELALASVYIPKRHQEDHRRLRLFIGLIEQPFPSIGPEPHGARKAIDPRLPHHLITIGVNFIDGFYPKRAGHRLRNRVVVSHDRTDRRFGSFLVGKVCITCLSPDMGDPFRGWNHIWAGKNADYVAIKFTERHRHVLGGQRMLQFIEAIVFLILLVHKVSPSGAGGYYSAQRQPAIRAKPALSLDWKIAEDIQNVCSGDAATQLPDRCIRVRAI